MELRFPCASRSSQLPSILPFVAVASFWLVVALKIIDRRPFKAAVYFILYIFCRSIRRPKRWDGVPPRAPRPARLRSNTPPTASADYRVDCCLKSPNGGHLRPGPGASLYFFVRPIPTLQSTEPATARAHRTPRACFRPIGSGGAMSWRRRWPTHGGRGPKPLEGRAAAAHVGCCVLWLCGCVVVLCASGTILLYAFCNHPWRYFSPIFEHDTVL